jgi:PKD repeat protein
MFKKLITTVLTAIVLFSFSGIVANAGPFDDLFQQANGREGLSFTEFQGGLTQLSDEGYDESLTQNDDIRSFIITTVNFALGFLGLLAVVMIIYGGFLYVSSAGETEGPDKAKKIILYAAIGILIILGSFAFVNTVLDSTNPEGEGGGQGVSTINGRTVGANTGASFNAASSEVRTLARDIYDGFVLLSEAREDLSSIVTDLDKSSLSFRNGLVSKANILNYLFTVRDKLINIRKKVDRFSEPYIEINKMLRIIDQRIDKVRTLNQRAYARAGGTGAIRMCVHTSVITFDEPGVSYAKVSDLVSRDSQAGAIVDDVVDSAIELAEDVGNFFGAGSARTTCEADYNPYINGLYQEWTDFVDNDFAGNPNNYPNSIKNIMRDFDSEINVARVFDALKQDYDAKLEDIYLDIQSINSQLFGLEAAENGSEIADLFEEMDFLLGLSGPNNNGENPAGQDFRTFIQTVQLFTDINDPQDSQLDRASRQLFEALQVQLQYSEVLKSLRSVEARLRADVVRGNAPLVVTFDVLESIDPAGGTIIDTNVDWQGLEGDVLNDGTAIDVNLSNAVQCNNEENLSLEDQEIFGPSFRKCNFKFPGTYTARVEIDSNDPKKYVPGVSTLTIKVEPPNTQINLEMTAGAETVDVIKYYNSGNLAGALQVDRDNVPVTLAEAQAGITFDASRTEDVQAFNWNFGNGQQISGEGAGFAVQNVVYETAGRYEVSLEVTNTLNQTDRKLFIVDVQEVAPRIEYAPSQKIFIETPVRFDGTRSKASSGIIRAYRWNLVKIDSNEEISLGGRANEASFTYEFQEPGAYEMSLTVTSDTDTSDPPARETFVVQSKPPIALFDHEVKHENLPGHVSFSARRSYDPDGSEENLEYAWTIDPASENGTNWQWQAGGGFNDQINERDPVIEFREKGDYEVTLRVSDRENPDEFTETSDVVTVEEVLDIDWGDEQTSTAILNEQGIALMNFYLESEHAVAYEIDFGDGETASGSLNQNEIVSHVYSDAGKYNVKVTVYDSEDNDNTIQRRVFVGALDNPLAKIKVYVDGARIFDLGEVIEVGRNDLITFDASDSINTDGTGRDLEYSWDFGDQDNSSRKISNHKYQDLSPINQGHYRVKLRITDKDDPTKVDEDEVRINVVNKYPRFSDIQGNYTKSRQGLETPVDVDMQVFGAEDSDGRIVQYKWWYFDIDDPEEKLGLLITQDPSAKLTIGTRGPQGQKVEYGFGLEITDNDGLSYSNENQIESDEYFTIEVVNGANDLPEASFTVNSSSIFVGEKAVFTSTSSDSDGQIVRYIWDFEGDGFFNNAPTDQSTVEHIYEAKNLSGYKVRLKVIDDKAGEAISEPVSVVVDSTANPPTAAFTYNVVDGSQGMRVQFNNNSTADSDGQARIIRHQWDFNNLEDSDGDGNALNDEDSISQSPSKLYDRPEIYQVTLTVTDNQGNSDSVTNQVHIPLADPPTAAFTYRLVNDQVLFENNSRADENSDAVLESYQWDFDTSSNFARADFDGDGEKDNDNQSQAKNPAYRYDQAGEYFVKLTVTDNQGNTDFVVNPINYVPSAESILGEDYSSPDADVNLVPIVQTVPPIDVDGNVYLNVEGRQFVRFIYSQSQGDIAYYVFDKNIYQDSDNDGISDNDEDFISETPGSWSTFFTSDMGQVATKLSLRDLTGNEKSITIPIKFK